MNDYDAMRVLRILTRHFHKTGSSGPHTGPFDALDKREQDAVGHILPLDAQEVPVIASFRSFQKWAVITTKHLVVREDDSLIRIPHTRIEDIRMNADESTLLDGGKDEVDQLVVQTQYGEEIHLTTDPGSPLFAFWNSLLMARKMAPEEERRRRESGLDA